MRVTLHTIKLLDRVIGQLATALMPRSRAAANAVQISKILIIRPGGIGDAVLLLPAIRILKQQFPLVGIDVLAEQRNSEVFQLAADIGTIYHYDRPSELFAVLRSSYDVVIDTEQWHRLSAVVARMVRSLIKIGYATNERSRLFTHVVPYTHDTYEADSFLQLLGPLGEKAAFDPGSRFILVPEPLREKAAVLLGSLHGSPLIALFPGGSIRERQWGGERFRLVAERLADCGYAIVVVGDAGDRAAGEEIVQGKTRGLNLCGRLSLPETAAVLGESALLISGDSGIMHLGYAVGAKVVALFGPGREKKWAPRSERVTVINKRLACSPCTTFGYTPKCRTNAECMKQITVEDVLAGATELLGRP